MTIKPIPYVLYVVDDSLIEDLFSFVLIDPLKIDPLKYGKRVIIHQYMLDHIVESYRIKRVPFICDDTIGSYDSKLGWSTGINDYLPESYFPKWLKTQYSRYAQIKLMDIL